MLRAIVVFALVWLCADPSHAGVTTTGCSAANVFCTLDELLLGGQMQVDGVAFENWAETASSVDFGTIDRSNVAVYPVGAGTLRKGVRFVAMDGWKIDSTISEAAQLSHDFEYDVRIESSSPYWMFAGATQTFDGLDLLPSSRTSAGFFVTMNIFADDQFVEQSYLGGSGSFLFPYTGPDSSNDVAFESGPTIRVAVSVDLEITSGSASLQLTEFAHTFVAVLPTFSDVPPDHWAYELIETLAASGITFGCSSAKYCPDDPVTRAQMAVFLERGMKGGDYSPPAASGNVFLDVGSADFAASFIEQLYSDGVTAGCGNNRYCPHDPVSRAQMAVFLLRAKYGAGYSPPPATGTFNDVDLSHWAVHWIEQLAEEGITSGCGSGNYCPEAPVTRAQMAVLLVRAFGL